MTHKTCPACGESKPVEEFYRLARSRDGRQGYCKLCANRKRQEWKKANPDKELQWRKNSTPATRNYRLTRMYNISAEEYDALLARQGGGCATCGRLPVESEKAFPVDHDHSCCPGRNSCGECVRGILCPDCNHALGNARDSSATLRALAEYLDRNNQCDPVWPPKN